MHPQTLALHPATQPSADFAAIPTAIHRASTVLYPTSQAWAQRHNGESAYVYGTMGTPTTRALELAMAANDGGTGCVLVPSGLAALTLVNMALLKSGDEVLIGDNGYEPNRSMFAGLFNKFGVTCKSFNPLDIASLNAAFTPATKLVWVEPVGSNTREVCDLRAIAASTHANVHNNGAVLASDHTYTAGVLLNVFDCGVDIAIQAMTKYPCGHSDALMGSVVWRDAAIGKAIHTARECLGYSVSPDECALMLRGLPTMRLRLAAQGTATTALAQFLHTHPAVAEVLHPALPHCAGHDIWLRDYTGVATIFSFTLKPQYDIEAAHRLINALKLFGIGASWGGVHSLAIVQTIYRHTMPAPLGVLIRLQIGLEHADDLQADLAAALAGMG